MSTAESALVREVLEEYGGVARARLREYLRPEQGGELYALAADYPERGGRTLRASLCLAAARAFGAPVDEAVNSAIALELMHNAFLVHDDIEDESEERRGRPALHVLHGVPIALNVGDALAVLSLRPLIANHPVLGPRLTLRILEETERMARASVEGQAMELAWRRDNALDVRAEDYLRMILLKTCWYTTIYPCRVGALIGTRGAADLDRYVRFGFFLGAAFQIQDDLLNLVGNKGRYGKELGGDLCEGKRTLMLVRLLERASPGERARLGRLLRAPRTARTAAQVDWIRARLDHHGCLEYARRFAHGLAGAALHEAAQAFGDLPPSRDKEFLQALPRWMIERT